MGQGEEDNLLATVVKCVVSKIFYYSLVTLVATCIYFYLGYASVHVIFTVPYRTVPYRRSVAFMLIL